MWRFVMEYLQKRRKGGTEMPGAGLGVAEEGMEEGGKESAKGKTRDILFRTVFEERP